MSPSSKETADLLRRISALDKIPPQAIMPTGGSRVAPNVNVGTTAPYDPSAMQKAGEAGMDLAKTVAEGGLTVFGQMLRALTGLGRGVTNGAAGVLPHINNIWDTYKDGFQVEDIGKTVAEGFEGAKQSAWGVVKGIAVSGVPAAKELIETVDKRPIYETGTELFTSKDFNELMKNIQNVPFVKQDREVFGLGIAKTIDNLASLNDKKTAEEIVVPGLDIFGVKVLQMNKAQAYGLGWDIFTDPATYATLGIAGALKGLGRGVSSVTKYQKAGKPANFAEVTPKALPRPYYADVKGAKAIPYAQPTYTVMNTSPITYILKEMGRGFTEAHMLRLHKVAAKTTAMSAQAAFRSQFEQKLVEGALKNDEITGQYIEEIVSVLREDSVVRQRQALVEQGITDPMEIERIVASTNQALDVVAERIAANAPAFISTLSSKEAADNIRRIAEERGITPIEAGMMEIADVGARELLKTTPAVARLKKPRFNVTQASTFGRALESASDPKNVSGDFGKIWEDFITSGATKTTVDEVWGALVKPIGYREAENAARRQATAESLAETQDYLRALYSLDLSPAGKQTRTPRTDEKIVVVPIAKKLARIQTTQRASGEYKQISKIVRMARDTRQGAGSKLTAKSKRAVATATDITNAPTEFLRNLTKNYYETIVAPKIPKAPVWDDLSVEQKADYSIEVINNPELITSDIFNKSFVNATVMAARINYLAERATITETKEYRRILDLMDQQYNPITVRVAHPKLYTLAFDASEKSAAKPVYLSEVIKLMRVAAGHIQDPVINKILYKLGVNRATLQTPNGLVDTAKIEEILFEAHTAIMVKARQTYIAKLKTTSGEYSADNLVDPNLLDADMESLFGEYIKDLQVKGRIASEEEIRTAIEKLADLTEQQIAAKETLDRMGFDIVGTGASAFKMLTTFQSIRKAKAQSTESKTFKEIETVIAKPKDQAARQSSIEVFQRIIPQLEEIAARPTTSTLIKNAISEILDGKVNLRKALNTQVQGATLDAYFSLMGNIIRQTKDRIQKGTVIGYDKVFARQGGEYDQQAIVAFLEQAYRASKSQDSLDGGYFAEQLDRLVAQKNVQKPLAEQTTEEARKSLASIEWNGEGISAGLLQTIIRFTEKQQEKVKPRELSEREIADMDRVEESLYDELIEGLTEQEKQQFRVATLESDVVIDQTGTGRMTRVILENLDTEELAIYKKIKDEAVLTVDPNGNVLELLKKMESAIQTVSMKGQIKLQFPPKIYRDGQWMTIKSLSEIQPGDRFFYQGFTKLSFELQKMKKDAALQQLWQAAKALSQRGIANTEKTAIRAIERRRASLKAQELFPFFAQRVNMAKSAAKIADPVKAGVNWRARSWLANLVIAGDKGIREIEYNDPVLSKLRQRVAKDATRLQEESSEFKKILSGLTFKFAKEGYKASKAKVEDMDIAQVIELKNPQDTIRKIASMRVVTDDEKDQWVTAMQELLNLQITGKGRRYENFLDLYNAYKNPRTAEDVPTDEEVLKVLLKLEGPISEKAKELLERPQIKRGTVLSLLRRMTGEIKQAELDSAKDASFMKRINAAGSKQINDVVETLPESKTLQQEMLNQISLERVKLHDEGLGWIELLVADAMGKQNKQFILDRLATHGEAEVDAMGRLFTADAPRPTFPRKGMKFTYEKQTLYTGWKRITKGLAKMAESKGYAKGSAEYQQFMTEMSMRALRLRDMHLNVLGIFPSNTAGLKAGENKILEMGVYTAEEVKGISKPVYLTDADILDIFPPDMIGNMLMVGPARSMPITSFAPAASLLVSALDVLKPGEYFDATQLKFLGQKMADLMRNDMKKVAKISKTSKISHYNMNAEEFEQNIRTVVAWMLSPENATKLWEQHIMNAAYATKIYQYKSGRVTKPIIEALAKMFTNPMASAGNKIQAMLDASEEIRKLTGREDLSPEVLFQAELDLNMVIAAYVDRDSLTIAQEALRVESAVKSIEGQAILTVQKRSSKNDLVKRMNQIRLEAEKAREELYVSLAQLKTFNDVKALPEVGKDDPFDVWADLNAAHVEIKKTLRFANAFGRLFYNYSMENLRPLYGIVERRRVNDHALFEKIAADIKANWVQRYPDRNILGEAWAIIQTIPDDVLDSSLQARLALREAENAAKATKQKVLTPEQYEDLITKSNKIESILALEDKDLNEAVSQLWSLGGRIFSGGNKSEIRLLGITPQWLNKNLREIGGGNVRAAINDEGVYTKITDGYGFTNSKSMTDIWREWEIVNPVEMITTMHQALRRSFVIPNIADDAVRLYGVPKTKYKNAAEAAKDGLVAIKPVESIQKGKELVYFMNVEEYYFPIQIAQELKTFSEFLGEAKYINGKEGVSEKILTKFAEYTNFTKVMMTILRPGNYVQNGLGAMWANSMSGVISPMAYARAIKTLESSGRSSFVKRIDVNQVEDLMAQYEAIVGREGFTIKSVNDPRKSDTISINIKGKAYLFRYTDIEKLANKYGVRIPVAQNRDADLIDTFKAARRFVDFRSIRGKIAKKYNNTTYLVGRAHAQRDEFFRMAKFIDELTKYSWNSLEDGARAAIKEVDKYHPQVQDLAAPLQKTRQFLLFQTWKTKMMATVLVDLLDKPGPIVNSIRAIEASNNSIQESSSSRTPFNLSPQGVILPERYQFNLDPIGVDTNTGALFKYSLANPVTDLYGSNGLLTAINFNTYQPLWDQMGSVIFGDNSLTDRYFAQSMPFVLDALINYPQGRTTGGTDWGTGGLTAKDYPAIFKDVMVGSGLNPLHSLLTLAFPGLATGRLSNLSPEDRQEEVLRIVGNFFTGLKTEQLDTIKNRELGIQELLTRLKELKGMSK